MSIFDSMSLSASGLNAQRTRMNVISSNIANVNTTRTPQGGPYKRRDVIFGALPPSQSFLEEIQQIEDQSPLKEVKVLGIVEDSRPSKLKFDPSHPDSNEEGYVAVPNVDISEEVVNMLQARRTYEANIAAFNVSKQLASTALNIGRQV